MASASRPHSAGWQFFCSDRGTILRTYGRTLGLHAAAALLTSIVVFYALARVAGLADLGRRVDLVERGIRRGSGMRTFKRLSSGAMQVCISINDNIIYREGNDDFAY